MVDNPCCPTCGRLLPPAIPFSPSRQRIYDCVAKHPDGIGIGDLASYVYADRVDGGPETAFITIRSQIGFINKVLKPLGLIIRGSGGPGSTYSLKEWHG